MNLRLPVTPFYEMVNPLSVYNHKNRPHELAPEMKWIMCDNIRILAFDEFSFQTRLSVVRLEREICEATYDEPAEFFTEVFSVENLETAAKADDVTVETGPSQQLLTIHTDEFQYNVRKVSGSQTLELRQTYLPMKQPIVRGSISSTKLYAFIKTAPEEPVWLKIRDGIVAFVSESTDERARYNVTDTATVVSDIDEVEYSYDLAQLSESVGKFPEDRPIQFFATKDLLRLRYELGENIGYMNYYQRSKKTEHAYVV